MKVVRKNLVLYHVQYFGVQAKHGWTQPRRVIPFEGLTKFVVLGDLKRPPYAVPLRQRDAWMAAVDEANAAMELTRTERKQKLTFEYYDSPPKPARNVKAVLPLQENSSVEKAKDELCLVCEKTGATLACTGPCKMSFHLECLGIAHPPAVFLCDECTTALKHEPIGEFAVRFYGSHDYYWTNKRRVFLFEEGDGGSLTASSKSVARLFEAALEEATLASEQQRKAREQSEKPAPFRMIRSNRPVGHTAMPSVDVYKESSCLCNPEDPCRTNCLNRLMLYECNRCLCPAGNDCENQRFQRRQYAKASRIRSPGRGWGLQADQSLAAGDFVMEYVGEIIDEAECERRLAQLHMENIQNFYFLTLDKNRIIDAGPRGNLSRFINHSCEPNCETQKWTVNGDTRVGIFAICDITPGLQHLLS
ncbi:hypothetical protein V5799_021411 [Amblyomma americanum]|uniref:Uncharacterized protein n=1 Tax=Amblyomma americanum TaxID=6943 RepID=A0AAQ4FNB9_AMBAM